jgi:hypothetical protein
MERKDRRGGREMIKIWIFAIVASLRTDCRERACALVLRISHVMSIEKRYGLDRKIVVLRNIAGQVRMGSARFYPDAATADL